ncbi:hypothetical protein DFJ63DRAFT_334801 [Scheffersomyces coipomensis]|uniref:uncharacterized protein n=1 Tax=Scheffersomyces coipomensis TaxID=1788519 RepID=UPI00315C8A96
MISRTTIRNGILPLVRYNSSATPSGSSSSSNPIFLSELLKRIDTVTSNIKQKNDEVKSKPKSSGPCQKRSKAGNNNNNEFRTSTPRNNNNNNNNNNNSNNNQFARGANHPFRVNNNYRPREPREPRDPRDPNQPQQNRSNYYQNNNNNTNSSNNTFENRDSRPQRNFRRSDAQPRDHTRERPGTTGQAPRRDATKRPARASKVNGREVVKKPAVAPPIAPKTLPKPQALNPAVTADTFLHGKVTSVNHTLNSRLVSLTKETLIKSKYPYLVPSEILSKLSSESKKNKFIVQKNWNLKVNQNQFKHRFSELVKGDVKPLQLAESNKDNQLVNELSASALSKNPTLTHEKKQLLYDVINGVKSVKDLITNAAWNKK